MKKLNCVLPRPCGDDKNEIPQEKKPTPAFDVCVGDRTLHWDGTHLTMSRPRTTPNGTYGTVTLEDGCIVAYGDCLVPTYTPPFCNPNPTPCTDKPVSTDTAVISARAGNQLLQDSFGLYARAYLSVGDGLTLLGQGTAHDPYHISFANSTGGKVDTVIRARTPLIMSDLEGVTYIDLDKTGVVAGVYGQFTVDSYGRITNVSDSPVLKGSDEISVTSIGDDSIISLADSLVGGNTYELGGYMVSLSKGGRVIGAERTVNITAGIYKLGAYNVQISDTGAIKSVTQDPAVPTTAGQFMTLDGKVVTYDDTGRITAIRDLEETEVDFSTFALRDTYKIMLSPSSDSTPATTEVDTFGTPLVENTAMGTPDKAVFTLPSYILDEKQVQLVTRGGVIATFDVATRQLTITAPTRNQGGYVTVAVRG